MVGSKYDAHRQRTLLEEYASTRVQTSQRVFIQHVHVSPYIGSGQVLLCELTP